MASADKLVIAHRGASGYIPEHTLAAKAMAHAMNADYIEQDLVLSKDGEILVLHDHFLDRVTNVAEIFPGRQRSDGRFYVIDFTWEEIQKLKMTEGFQVHSGQQKANFPQRFPVWKSRFGVHTFSEEIELIQGLNQSTGKSIGIYPEIKSPAFHRNEGQDISLAVLSTLKKYGYTQKKDAVFLQCFDPIETQRIAQELFTDLNIQLKLVQLIAETDWNETLVYAEGGKTQPYKYDWMFKPGAMAKIAQYADGIGPWKPMLLKAEVLPVSPSLMLTEAKQVGLKIHPYTFRLDEGRIPDYAKDFENLLEIFYFQLDVEGVFTDFPDRAVQYLKQKQLEVTD